MRVPQIDAACHKSSVNRFLGYCRGIACDGVITIREAEGLLKRLEDSPAILETTGVRQIFVCATDAIADGILDAAESEEICAAISRVVGDCYADTGIAGINKTAVFDEFRLENLEVDFLDARIVLTGKFKSSPRSEFERELEAFGATFLRSVSKKTDFLVVGGEASRDWIEQNRGTKMRKAEELRIQGSRPLFVSEAQILRFLRG